MFALYWGLALFCWGFALRFGGKPAWHAFILFVFAMIFTTISTDLVHWSGLENTWAGMNLPLLITDAVYFLGLYGLAIRHGRYWLVWSAGLQLACVLTHLGPLVDPSTDARLYRALETVWMLPMLITMVIGIARSRRTPS